MKSLIAIIVICTCAVTGHRTRPRNAGLSYNATCINPNSKPGRCVLVRECQIVLSTLRKETLNSDEIDFLYRSECGKMERKSLVCCPSYSISSNDNGTSPVGSSSFDTSNRVDGDSGGSLSSTGSSNRPKVDQWKLLPQPGECGVQPNYQLFGENVTKLDEQPWTALVHFGNMPYETTFECGAALISSSYVLTAAHCVADRAKWSNLTVRLGEWDTDATVDCIAIEDYSEFYCADPAIDVAVEKVFVHEQYARHHRPQLNDIALLRLAEPVTTSSWIRPVCLPERPVLPASDEVLILAGWGNNGCGYNSRYKVRSRLNALKQDQCRGHLPPGFRRVNDYICTAPVTEGEKCHADSGGAVTSTRQVESVGIVHEVAGILNHMVECHVSRPVGVFTSVGQYLEWIVNKLEK